MAYQQQQPQQGKAMSVRDQKVAGFKGLINTQAMVKRLTTTLGDKDKAGQFMASMLDLYEGDTALQNCDPQKVLMECLKAASLNLPIVKGLGFTYVVPYGSTPTFIIGYKGYIQLALRSGQYKILNADCIYEGEEIKFNRLTGQIEIAGSKTSEKAIGYFAYFQLINGFEKTLYMTVEEIQTYARKYSKAYKNGPWQTEFDAMAKKTVLRQILKYGPMSTEMQEAEKAEIQSAEIAAQAEVEANANQGAIIDVQYADANEPVPVDEATGEILEPGYTSEIPGQPDF